MSLLYTSTPSILVKLPFSLASKHAKTISDHKGKVYILKLLQNMAALLLVVVSMYFNLLNRMKYAIVQ